MRDLARLRKESDEMRVDMEAQLCLEKLEVQTAKQSMPEISDLKSTIKTLEAELKKVYEVCNQSTHSRPCPFRQF